MTSRNAKAKRTLPPQSNPELMPERTPEYHRLVSERRLGQTDLVVKKGQVGTSNATKKENLGPFNYAYLKRRSSDGYLSASGMFKAAFPWATLVEEKAEKDHLKTLDTTSTEEVAGNIWVSEATALELAEDYDIVPWIAALLDPAPVEKASESQHKSISPPPKYVFTANDKTHLPPPLSRGSTPARARGRPRNGSPAKSEKAASPRKPRVTKAMKAENEANTKAAASSLQEALKRATPALSDKTEDQEMVKVELNEVTETKGDTKTTTTNVMVDLPGGMAAQVPPQEQTEEIIREAKAVVEAARKLEGESSKGPRKRKAEEMDEDSNPELDNQLQPAKKARLAEQALKKEKVKNRALFGVAATLVIGTLIPYLI
ncbi:MAG: hypothetical protein Q9208_005852 [Pyrenodesmia sp. 3 TL-2023]